jgi:hypothetical protein
MIYISLGGVTHILDVKGRTVSCHRELEDGLLGGHTLVDKSVVKKALIKASLAREITPSNAAEWGSNLQQTTYGCWRF